MEKLNQKDILNITTIMILFLVRDNGFTKTQAEKEADLIFNQIGYYSFSKNSKLYLRMRRVGSTKKLSRLEKISVISSVENAFNHALFN